MMATVRAGVVCAGERRLIQPLFVAGFAHAAFHYALPCLGDGFHIGGNAQQVFFAWEEPRLPRLVDVGLY